MQKPTLYLKNAVLLTVSGFGLRAVGMLFRVWLAAWIGAEGMGLYQLALSVYNLAVTFATAGISVAATRLVAEELAGKQPSRAAGALQRVARTGAFLGLAAGAVQFFAAYPAAKYLLGDARAELSLKLLAPSLPFMAVAAALRGYFLARRKVAPSVESQMAEQLDKHELDAKLKTYLERLRGLSAACGISGDAVRAVYEKTMILRKLCDVAAYTSRKLTEAEKDYLFRYLREAVIDGFAPKDIGLDDMVLARLMADSVPEGASELEKAPLLSRNAEIEEFAAGLEEEQGFFEETAARYIRLDPGKTRELTQRCLKLIAAGKRPKGVIFALALLEMRQVKSAVQILLELRAHIGEVL